MEMDIILSGKINLCTTVSKIKNQASLIGISLFFSLVLLVSSVSAAGDQLTIGQAYFTLNNKEVMLFADIPDPVIEAQPDMISLSLDGTGMKKARISNFCRSDVPLTFLFLIDTKKTVYESEKNRPEEVVKAFRDFYFFQGHSKIAIMTYGDSTKVVLEPTSDPAAIEQAALKIRFISKDSSFPDALLEAVDYVNKISANDGSFKNIVLFTDGKGYDNRYISEADMIKTLQGSGISLFVLKTHDTNAYYGTEAKEHAESPGWFATYSPELYPL
ncbi:MAG: vWA domain-containing protein, partial [Bacillota bacterium]